MVCSTEPQAASALNSDRLLVVAWTRVDCAVLRCGLPADSAHAVAAAPGGCCLCLTVRSARGTRQWPKQEATKRQLRCIHDSSGSSVETHCRATSHSWTIDVSDPAAFRSGPLPRRSRGDGETRNNEGPPCDRRGSSNHQGGGRTGTGRSDSLLHQRCPTERKRRDRGTASRGNRGEATRVLTAKEADS